MASAIAPPTMSLLGRDASNQNRTQLLVAADPIVLAKNHSPAAANRIGPELNKSRSASILGLFGPDRFAREAPLTLAVRISIQNSLAHNSKKALNFPIG